LLIAVQSRSHDFRDVIRSLRLLAFQAFKLGIDVRQFSSEVFDFFTHAAPSNSSIASCASTQTMTPRHCASQSATNFSQAMTKQSDLLLEHRHFDATHDLCAKTTRGEVDHLSGAFCHLRSKSPRCQLLKLPPEPPRQGSARVAIGAST
jgi:hypothetical protein